jgi:hypothetical protein
MYQTNEYLKWLGPVLILLLAKAFPLTSFRLSGFRCLWVIHRTNGLLVAWLTAYP